MKMSIYPSKEELRGTTEAYLKENHLEFFSKFSEINWTSYYNDNIHKNVSSFPFEFIYRLECYLFLLNLYIDKNINILSKVIKASSFLTRFIGYKNKRSNIRDIRRGKLTFNKFKC